MKSILPKELIIASNAYKNIGAILSRYGKRVYILRAGGSFKNSFWAKEIVALLKKSELDFLISRPIPPEPEVSIVRELIREARSFKADIICGIGGGSVMDAAKMTAACFNEKFKNISEYLYSKKIESRGVKCVLLTTTSGSGSEVSSSVVLGDSSRGEKRGVRDQKLIADLAIIDPVVTLTLGRDVTLYSALDALTHAVEAYVSTDVDVASSILARRASEIIYKNLSRALKEPRDMLFRQRLSYASLFAALAFSSSGLGLAHALSHPIGMAYGLSHGLVNAVIIPHVVEFNYSVAKESYQDLIFDKRYKSLYNLLKSWLKKLGIPSSFKELGLKIDNKLKDKIASATLNSGVLKYNPKGVKEEDIYYILERLWVR
ncbi:MAG: iron-containing alcohol dehydrogenase [Candidatus Kaelpia imicola]|nr:iron-containing alcohol dehydrogenase [Candidatus Kaelpia imicola]